MPQSPAQKAAFEKMLAARKAKSGVPEEKEKPSVRKTEKPEKFELKSKKVNVKKMAPNQVNKIAGRIRQRINEKSKRKTEVGFD